ncbi:hypothetical protein C8J57DRAFT_1602980 [Mycena rebaudengoi]|nr:hypothetical protein C8J57DRAFT_1602980 [Mycena rebaudengoi]
MRPSIILLLSLSLTGAHASWFGSDTPQYNEWSAPELRKWLAERNIKVSACNWKVRELGGGKLTGDKTGLLIGQLAMANLDLDSVLLDEYS